MSPAPPDAVVYVSYDGALDPLGASQIVPYVAGLARHSRFTLVSFEKAARWQDRARRDAMRSRLQAAGVAWRPLRYHSSPRVPATAWDLARGAAVIAREVRSTGATLVHCRGEIAMLMARCAALPTRARLLLDMRGFFADERAESGSWAAGGAVDRAVRSVERANLRRADGLVVLTNVALEVLRSREEQLPPVRVIPTCADETLFRPRPAAESPSFAVVYSGSLGTWYMLDAMVSLAREIVRVVPGRALFLTPDESLARDAGVTPEWAELRAADPADVPGWLRSARASFFLIRPTPAKRASCPTKLAEALASGLPVVANRGIGDVDRILTDDRVGVLVDELTPAGFRRAAMELAALIADPDITARCRGVAERQLGLKAAVASYESLYAEMLVPSGGRPAA